jgi:hypothetical protein
MNKIHQNENITVIFIGITHKRIANKRKVLKFVPCSRSHYISVDIDKLSHPKS